MNQPSSTATHDDTKRSINSANGDSTQFEIFQRPDGVFVCRAHRAHRIRGSREGIRRRAGILGRKLLPQARFSSCLGNCNTLGGKATMRYECECGCGFERWNADLNAYVCANCGTFWEEVEPFVDLTGDGLAYDNYTVACADNDMMPVSFEAWKNGTR